MSERYSAAHRRAVKLAEEAYELGETPEERADLYHNAYQAAFCRELKHSLDRVGEWMGLMEKDNE